MTSAPDKAAIPVLVVADPQDDLKGLVEALAGEVKPVTILTDEEQALQTIAEGGPLVLVLAFSRLELSQTFYLRTLKRGPRERLDALQTLVLCDRAEARKSYDLARDDVIDDYLVARPLYDPWQLAFAVKQARDRLMMHRWAAEVTGGEHRDIGRLVGALEEAVSVQAPHNAPLREAVANLKAVMAGLSAQLTEGARMVEASRTARQAATNRNASPAARQTAEPAAPEPAADAPTILVVEDDEFYQRVVGRVLESAGHRVVAVPSAETGLAALKRRRVDLVMMDVELPGMTGIEATRRIRQDFPAERLPVIVLTRHSDRATVTEALEAGATDFIVKPGSRETLLLKVGHALSQRGAAEAATDAGKGSDL